MTILTIPRADIKLIQGNGIATRDLYRWMATVTQLLGGDGANGSAVDALTQDLSADAGLYAAGLVSDALSQLPALVVLEQQTDTLTELAMLRAEVERLSARVEELQQGTTL